MNWANLPTILACLSLCILASNATAGGDAEVRSREHTLWFASPASDWETEGLPIGNGAMGAVILGGTAHTRIQFNEKTLWTGGPGSKEGYDFGHPSSPEAYQRALAKTQQQLIKSSMSPEAVADALGREVRGYGHYQNFGFIDLTFDHDDQVEQYRRELDLDTAVASVTYHHRGAEYRRRYFASYPDGVIVVLLETTAKQGLSFRVRLSADEGRSVNYHATARSIAMRGALDDNGLRYEARLGIDAPGAKFSVEGESLRVEGAKRVLMTLAAATDYAPVYPHYRGELDGEALKTRVLQALDSGRDTLLERHIADHQSLYRRLTLDLFDEAPSLSLPERMQRYRGEGTAEDRALEHLYFQYGRYLLIASSRAGSLPANLQGVWNHSNFPPWNADYHVNINLQMNYWPAHIANLDETALPLFDFIDALIPSGEVAAQKLLGARGWTLFLNTNIYGFSGVIRWPTAFWQPEAGAWLAQHYYEAYLFSQDKTFLERRAYPAMKGAALFWLDALVKNERGEWVVSPSYSPEHGPFMAGVAMSQQLVFDLFQNTREAAAILGDDEFGARIVDAQSRLAPGLKVGSWGQLQEWPQDVDDEKNDHRHVSHLFALHPGDQISTDKESEYLRAARVSLNARGDAGTGWSKAWKVNLWARLQDGNRAYKLLTEQLKHSTLTNLWDNHPPFQIDGNFGATAGVIEMLLQSHNGVLALLPALPDAWPEGTLRGAKARGNIEVSLRWDSGVLREAELRAEQSQAVQLKLPESAAKQSVALFQGDNKVKIQREGRRLSATLTGGETYRLVVSK